MNFWKMVYDLGWIDLATLRQAVITKANPFGDITPEEFEQISGTSFEG